MRVKSGDMEVALKPLLKVSLLFCWGKRGVPHIAPQQRPCRVDVQYRVDTNHSKKTKTKQKTERYCAVQTGYRVLESKWSLLDNVWFHSWIERYHKQGSRGLKDTCKKIIWDNPNVTSKLQPTFCGWPLRSQAQPNTEISRVFGQWCLHSSSIRIDSPGHLNHFI